MEIERKIKFRRNENRDQTIQKKKQRKCVGEIGLARIGHSVWHQKSFGLPIFFLFWVRISRSKVIGILLKARLSRKNKKTWVTTYKPRERELFSVISLFKYFSGSKIYGSDRRRRREKELVYSHFNSVTKVALERRVKSLRKEDVNAFDEFDCLQEWPRPWWLLERRRDQTRSARKEIKAYYVNICIN